MKKYVVYFYLVFCLCFCGVVYGASNRTENKYFSIVLPSGYSISRRPMENDVSAVRYDIFSDSEGEDDFSVIIDIRRNEYNMKYEDLDDEWLKDWEGVYRKLFEKQGVYDSVVDKKFYSVSKNNYKCMFIEIYSKMIDFRFRNYMILSDNYVYNIGISCTNANVSSLDYLFSDFTINDTITDRTGGNDTVITKTSRVDSAKSIVPDVSLLINFVLTITIYLGITLVLRFGFHKRFNKKTSFKVAFWLTVLGFLVFMVLYGVLGVEGVPNCAVAVLYFWISRGLLYDKNLDVESVDEENKTE